MNQEKTTSDSIQNEVHAFICAKRRRFSFSGKSAVLENEATRRGFLNDVELSHRMLTDFTSRLSSRFGAQPFLSQPFMPLSHSREKLPWGPGFRWASDVTLAQFHSLMEEFIWFWTRYVWNYSDSLAGMTGEDLEFHSKAIRAARHEMEDYTNLFQTITGGSQ